MLEEDNNFIRNIIKEIIEEGLWDKNSWKKAQNIKEEEEGGSYKESLLKIRNMSEQINDFIGKDYELPSWIQDKITIIEHNLDAIYDYLMEQNIFQDEEDFGDEELKEAYNLIEKGCFIKEGKKNTFFEVDEEFYNTLNEAEYQGRTVKLGKIMRGDVKKFKVYVKNEKGNVVKVNFGDPNMRIKKNIPARRRLFRARHRCETPGPRWKARYWACKTW